jgi:hypothetical protein
MHFYSFVYLLHLEKIPSVFRGSFSRKEKGAYTYHLRMERKYVYLQV